MPRFTGNVSPPGSTGNAERAGRGGSNREERSNGEGVGRPVGSLAARFFVSGTEVESFEPNMVLARMFEGVGGVRVDE